MCVCVLAWGSDPRNAAAAAAAAAAAEKSQDVYTFFLKNRRNKPSEEKFMPRYNNFHSNGIFLLSFYVPLAEFLLLTPPTSYFIFSSFLSFRIF